LTDLIVHPCTKPLHGSVPVPPDKSIAHRAILLASLCDGRSRLRTRGALGEDNRSTRGALSAMGIAFEDAAAAPETPETVVVVGRGLFGLVAPDHDLDCGNSGTTMRLLCGILAAQPFSSRLVGDASLSRRPMMRIAGPLRARGARIEGQPKGTDITAPIQIFGTEKLGPIEYELPVASAQVKSALLLSGLYARGATTLREPMLSRDHTERMLLALGVPLRTVGTMVELDPAGWSGVMPAFDIAIPGDISAAAFILGAALTVPGSRVAVRSVGTNRTRTGVLDALSAMGAKVAVEPLGEEGGEPVSNLHVEGDAHLNATLVGGELVPRAIDEIPLLCAVAARANGTTTIRDATELRVKESDRITAMAEVLRAFGVACEPLPDGLRIEGTGGARLGARVTTITSAGDHRIAMSAAVLALGAAGATRIRDCDCIATSFPRFVGTLRALGASIDVEGS
jgi:3-phosphoshikimate 1-carboxyvinyltransferase